MHSITKNLRFLVILDLKVVSELRHQAHLEHIHNTSEKLLRLVREREVMIKPDEHEKWAAAADDIRRVSLELHKIYGDLPIKFEKSLAFDQVISG